MLVTEAICVLAHRRDPERPRRAADGIEVCYGHRTGLARDLLELSGMYERLTAAHIARSGPQSEVRSGGHSGLTLSDPVALLRGNIYNELSTWARDVAEIRNWTLPADDVRSICRYLLGPGGTVLDWRLARPTDDVGEFHDAVDHLHREAFRLLHPSGRRRFEVGACIEVTSCSVVTRSEERCPGRMLATLTDADDVLPAGLWCDECGIEILASSWITYGRRVHKAIGMAV